METDSPGIGTRPRLRADARRNIEGIRRAALGVFRERGLGTALDDVARAAGVSKGTVYHRFGGRQGLIDAIVEELVGELIEAIFAEAAAVERPAESLETYLRLVWMLQFDEPAANDVLLRAVPESEPLCALCERVSAFGAGLLAAAQAEGTVRGDLTPDDVYALIRERGLVARACDRGSRAEYERRLAFVLGGILTR
ncbi:Transcriptional regulator, TetR family [Actinomycetales bacterium JB111]|nr:Transcriptional regulator, TetR family [Actinomycetales bacterium JB111]